MVVKRDVEERAQVPLWLSYYRVDRGMSFVEIGLQGVCSFGGGDEFIFEMLCCFYNIQVV